MKTLPTLTAAGLALTLAACTSTTVNTAFQGGRLLLPDRSWDKAKFDAAPLVLRAKILPDDHAPDDQRFPVEVVRVYKNTTRAKLPTRLDLYSPSPYGGLPTTGDCTVYLTPANPDDPTAGWSLMESSTHYISKVTPGYSHHHQH